MKHKAVSITIAIVSLGAVAAVAWWGFRQRTSPGPLHPTHAAIKELRGNDGCDACHGEGTKGEAMHSGMAASCLACHEPIRSQVAARTGIHGTLTPTLQSECEQCHREHLGATIAITSDNSFQLAGIPLVDKYAHTGTPGGLRLAGVHTRLECQNCHKSAYETMLGKGEFRYLGLTQACTQCHADSHKGELGSDCAKCHGEERPFKESPLFQHPDTFRLTGGHREAACIACHTESGVFTGLKTDCVSCHKEQFDKTTKPSHAGTGLSTDCAACHGVEKWDTGVKFTHPEPFTLSGAHAAQACNACHTTREFTKLSGTCSSCHQDAFDKTSAPNHKAAGMKNTCADCHGVDAWKSGVKFTHPASFPLVGAHTKAACAVCHTDGKAQQDVLSFAEQPTCAACHESPHDADMVRRASEQARRTGGDTCVTCHLWPDATWSAAAPRMTPAAHAFTGFPLSKPHELSDCAKCHSGYQPDRSAPLTKEQWTAAYPGRKPEQCQACHKDAHDGQFLGTQTGGRCLACHDAARFTPTQFGVSEHAKCRFPLDGSHTAVACSACHKVENGVRRFVPTSSVCADCHEDVHKGAFDTPASPRAVGGKVGCARCHTTADFRAVAWTSDDHKRWTSEELRGKHATAKCNDCHRRTAVPPSGTPGPPQTFAKAPTACAECHADVHAGQFTVRGVTDCARCHQSADSFATLTFVHDRDSRFVLDADHVKLACNACHRSYDTPAGAIVRYKPLGTRCADCHGIVPKKPGGQGP